MNQSVTSYHHGDLRNCAIIAAAELIESIGSYDITIAQVAKRVGVSPPARGNDGENWEWSVGVGSGQTGERERGRDARSSSILWRARDSSLMHQGPALQLGPWRGPRLDAMGRQPRTNGIVVQEI